MIKSSGDQSFAVHEQKKLCTSHIILSYSVTCFHNTNVFLEATYYIHKDNVYKYSESGIVYSVDEIFQFTLDIWYTCSALFVTDTFTQTVII